MPTYGSIASPKENTQDDSSLSPRHLSRSAAAVVGAIAVVVFLIVTLDRSSSPGQPHVPLLGATKPSSSLSRQGQGVQPVRDDLPMFQAGVADPYDPANNSDGYLVMLVAENKLMWKEMAARLEAIQSTPLPEWIFMYGSMTGDAAFRNVLANLFSKWIRAPVEAEYVQVQAGAGSVLSQLSYLLGDPDDAVLVAAPAYPAFPGDFNAYGGMKVHTIPALVPTREDLTRAYQSANAAGHPPKILLLCQPNNPTGTLYSKDELTVLVDWALDHGLHVVSDEIYALSVFPGTHTTSVADILHAKDPHNQHYLGEHVHIVAGLSKDWGLSGFRVGTLFTHNAALLQAMGLVGYYQAVSQYTQFALTQVLAQDEWVDWYIAENQRRLHDTYQALVAALDRMDVPVLPAQGALFAWADFSAYIVTTEQDLWQELFHDAKILFTSGTSCFEDKPGMFRVVYSWPEGGPVAMKELGDRLVRWKQQREANT